MCSFCFSCNSNSKSPNAIKLGVAGGDGYINTVLRPYIEQFSAKSPDWQNYVRFLVIPFGKLLSIERGIFTTLSSKYNWYYHFIQTERNSKVWPLQISITKISAKLIKISQVIRKIFKV